jgi:hypothetical protein
MQPPQYPAGPHTPEDSHDTGRREEFIAVIEAAPRRLREAIGGLSEAELDRRYKNWSMRQIVHHLADSHVNSYVRFKWTLTEDTPTLKAYHEGLWAALDDSRQGWVGPAVALLEGLHQRWVQLLRSLTPEQFSRSFLHPETGQNVSLAFALSYYAWHCNHHIGQLLWLRNSRAQ